MMNEEEHDQAKAVFGLVILTGMGLFFLATFLF
jgi:hypothetical protein